MTPKDVVGPGEVDPELTDTSLEYRLATTVQALYACQSRQRDGWIVYDATATTLEWCNARVVGTINPEHRHEPMTPAEQAVMMESTG